MIKLVILDSRNLALLEHAIAVSKARQICETKVEAFVVHGILRKHYYAVVSGMSGDLERMTIFCSKHSNIIKCHSVNYPYRKITFNEKKGDWVPEEK